MKRVRECAREKNLHIEKTYTKYKSNNEYALSTLTVAWSLIDMDTRSWSLPSCNRSHTSTTTDRLTISSYPSYSVSTTRRYHCARRRRVADAPTLTDYRCCACAYAHHYHYSLDDDNDYRVPSLQAVFQSSH